MQHDGLDLIGQADDIGATCADVLTLIEKVQKTVYDAYGVMLEPEVKIIR